MPNEKTEETLKREFSAGHKRERLSAWTIVAGLFAEIVILMIFAKGHSPWETALMIGATAIIAFGVGGEIWFGRKVEEAGDELHKIAEKRVADANAAAANANERAASLEKDAADARARTAEIERLTAWRRISPEQNDAIFRAIRGKLPSVITIKSVLDPEAITYARALESLFNDCDAKSVRRDVVVDLNTADDPQFGLYIASTEDVYRRVVQEAVRDAGIPINASPQLFADLTNRPTDTSRPAPPSELRLYVGYKPQI